MTIIDIPRERGESLARAYAGQRENDEPGRYALIPSLMTNAVIDFLHSQESVQHREDVDAQEP